MQSAARLFGLALLCAGAAAASSETLPEAWAAAALSHELIAAAEAEHEAARHDLDGAVAERRPRLDLETAVTRMDAAPRLAFPGFSPLPILDEDGFATASAQVSVPLYTGGMLRHGIAAAESFVDASEGRLGTVADEVRLAVAEAYIAVLRAERSLVVAESNVATLSAHTRDARNRFDSGAAPRNDFLAASVALAHASQGRLRAENELDFARAAYNRELGRPVTAPVDLDPAFALDALVPGDSGFEALVALATIQRPELASLEARAQALRARSAAERAGSKPHLALTGGYQRLETEVLDDDAFWTVGVALQWNVFDSGRSRNRAAALERRSRAVVHERADLERRIALQVRKALLDRTEAGNRREVAERAVEQAEENLEVARNRYLAGAGTNTEVLDAEALRAQSLGDSDSARFDAALATLYLARAIGAL